jgi:hypothetical protein
MVTTAITVHCSFCGRSNDAVDRLVGGPGVFICDTCVGLCVDVLDAHRGTKKVAELTPPWEQLDEGEMLAALPAIARSADRVEAHLGSWVEQLRIRGVTWERIGQALDISRQSAWERFSKLVDER